MWLQVRCGSHPPIQSNQPFLNAASPECSFNLSNLSLPSPVCKIAHVLWHQCKNAASKTFAQRWLPSQALATITTLYNFVFSDSIVALCSSATVVQKSTGYSALASRLGKMPVTEKPSFLTSGIEPHKPQPGEAIVDAMKDNLYNHGAVPHKMVGFGESAQKEPFGS